MIAIDIEVAEHSDWGTLGPGYHRKDAAILCIGLYDGKDYVCCEPDDPRLPSWLATDEDKIFHNSVYDTSWLVHGYGWKIGGIWHDTMTRAALIDEYTDLDLDSCCKRFRVEGKNTEDTLDTWFNKWKSFYGLRGGVWDNIDVIWMHPEGKQSIIKYNKQDCKATYDLFFAQEKQFKPHEEAYKLECDLQPVISILNGNGFPVDVVARDNFTQTIKCMLKETNEVLQYQYGITADTVKSPKKMTLAMNELGIQSPLRTETGNQSWNAAALAEIDHPVIEHIQNAKKYQTLIGNFLEGSLQKLVNGRAYSVFSPNKRDEGGTRTGRFGSRTINLQQIPSRTESAEGVKSYGKEMRSLFIPEPGCLLGAWDYNSIEMYGFAHFSVGERSDIFREQARQHADFHTMAKELSGLEERLWAKNLNFTVLYGAGPKGIFSKHKKAFKTIEKTTEIYNRFHSGMPYIHTTQQWAANETRAVGYIKSIGGRIHHKPKPYFDTERGKWNDGLYKMLNYLIQGSCADTLKQGLIDAYRVGVYSTLKLHATVHDENVLSIPYNKEGIEAAIEFQRCMENAFSDRWTVPISTGGDVGPNWGYQKDDIWQEMKLGQFDFNKYKHYVREV